MTKDFLKTIIEHKKKLLKDNEAFYAKIQKSIGSVDYNRYRLFKNQISKPDSINLIAEIKKASPSMGLIRDDFDVMAIAKIYVEHKAVAISVLTEEKYFLGNPLYVKKVSDNFNVPVLTKDFIIDERQIIEARFNGASAILLIMAILPDAQVKKLLKAAADLDLDSLVEVHDEEELKRALDCGAEILGVNNRNLQTLEVDFKNCLKIIPKIPKDKVVVAESGIKTREDVQELKQAGAHAVLIGETFMREKNIGKKIDEIMGN